MSCKAFKLDAARLRTPVQLQRRGTVQDERGQDTVTWATYATEWAEVRPTRGRDMLAAAQPQATFDAAVLIRYRADVLATDRVVWAGQPLELIGLPVNVNGANVALELLCTHGVRTGAPA
jgi:SPP1 family predicted phage head-tail adaptor